MFFHRDWSADSEEASLTSAASTDSSYQAPDDPATKKLTYPPMSPPRATYQHPIPNVLYDCSESSDSGTTVQSVLSVKEETPPPVATSAESSPASSRSATPPASNGSEVDAAGEGGGVQDGLRVLPARTARTAGLAEISRLYAARLV